MEIVERSVEGARELDRRVAAFEALEKVVRGLGKLVESNDRPKMSPSRSSERSPADRSCQVDQFPEEGGGAHFFFRRGV